MTSVETLRRIESYAPHILTDDDRRALRVDRWAWGIRLATIVVPALCALAFIGSIWGMK